MPVGRVFYAGATGFMEPVRKSGVKDVLVSFLELRESNQVSLEKLSNEGYNIFVDSGAYTFQESNNPKSEDWDEYLDEYINWLVENREHYEISVELDIDKLVGVQKVKEYRQQFHDAGLDPIVVWHPPRGLDEWKKHCREYDYIGFNTINDINDFAQARQMLSYANEHQTKVHGFGTTKASYMKHLNFYSVDSTSWLSGGRFGVFYYFNGEKLEKYSPDKFKEKFGRNFAGMHYNKMHFWNLTQWKQFVESVTDKSKWNNEWSDK